MLPFGFIQYFKNENIESLTQFSITDYFSHFFHFGAPEGNLSAYELSFVLLNIRILAILEYAFNAKAYRTGKSAFNNLGKSQGFMLIALAIVLGQVFITTFGGQMFNVTPLKLVDWAIIIGATSAVLWAGEILRAVKR